MGNIRDDGHTSTRISHLQPSWNLSECIARLFFVASGLAPTRVQTTVLRITPRAMCLSEEIEKRGGHVIAPSFVKSLDYLPCPLYPAGIYTHVSAERALSCIDGTHSARGLAF